MPRNLGNHQLKKMLFIQYFLQAMLDPDTLVVIQDEAG